jgi:hypothetical protein
MADQKD